MNIWAVSWIVQRIGGDLVDTPRLFEGGRHQPLTAADLDLLRSSSTDAAVYMGNLNAEAMTVLSDRAGRDPERFLDLSRIGDLHPHPAPPGLEEEQLPDGTDPHVWLDPGDRMGQIAGAVARALTEAVARHAQLGQYRIYYRDELNKRRDEVVNVELPKLRTEMERLLAGCKGRTLIPEHPAYGYLAEAFGLVQLPLTRVGADNRLPTGPEDAQARQLDAVWHKESPRVLFLEHAKGYGQELRDDAERLYFHQLANRYNADLSYLSSLETAPERIKDADRDQTYLEAMVSNAEHIKNGLRC